MLLFRMGPRYLFIRSEDIDGVADFLISNLNGQLTDFESGMANASEYSTICFITDTYPEKTYIEDAKKIVLVHDGSSVILSTILNNQACSLLSRVDYGPTSILMRIPGDEDKLVTRLQEIFHGVVVDWAEGIGVGEKDDTIISFTNRELRHTVSELKKPKLLIEQPARLVKDKLRLEGFRLITQSLEESQWYELRINIYDSYGRYEDHYNRLIFILSKLEVGMILGESWTKDYAVMLYSVLVYQVRLYTFLKPLEVKKILVALEYTIDGQRIIDFDLYYKNKKVYWNEVRSPKNRKTKAEDSKIYRKDLYGKLSPESVKTLENMEKAILKR
ncbi:MAG: hypothetical protein M0Q14_09620 [Tissierellaceae bacterium]|nr:hypothetical protein [Tissierellaceae bacterium]